MSTTEAAKRLISGDLGEEVKFIGAATTSDRSYLLPVLFAVRLLGGQSPRFGDLAATALMQNGGRLDASIIGSLLSCVVLHKPSMTGRVIHTILAHRWPVGESENVESIFTEALLMMKDPLIRFDAKSEPASKE